MYRSPFSDQSPLLFTISPWTKEPLFSSLATALLKHLEAKQLGVGELRHAASAFGQCRGGRTGTAGAGKIRGKLAFFGGKWRFLNGMVGKWLEHAGKLLETVDVSCKFMETCWKTCGLFWKNAGNSDLSWNIMDMYGDFLGNRGAWVIVRGT